MLYCHQVYRTWIVNDKDWRFVVVPAILVAGGTFAASGIGYSVSRLKTGGYTDPTVVPWTTSFLSLSIALNIMCTSAYLCSGVNYRESLILFTGMIIYRVLKATRAGPGSASKVKKSPLHLVTRVVIESGLLYTLTSIIMLALNCAANPAVYIVADSVRPSHTPNHGKATGRLMRRIVPRNHSDLLQPDHHPDVQPPGRPCLRVHEYWRKSHRGAHHA
jgi:hypothetical protein